MRLTIFEADLDRDRQVITDVLDRNRDYEVPPRRYDWLYLQNPAGRARVWLLQDDEAGVIGASAALPRKVWLRGKQVTCQVMSDFSIDAPFRTVGPAVKLSRRSLEPVFAGEVPFAYDFPTEAMSATYTWMKVSPIGRQLRFVLRLRLGPAFEKVLGKNVASRAAGWLNERALRAVAALRRLERTYRVDEIAADAFDAAFTELDAEVGPSLTACGVRDQAYLNWHYGMNPSRSCHVVRLARRGRLVGFAVYSRAGARIMVHDLFSVADKDVRRSLLAALFGVAVTSGADGIEISLLETNPWIPLLRRSGFLLRPPEDKIYVLPPRQSAPDDVSTHASSWYMTQGDTDT